MKNGLDRKPARAGFCLETKGCFGKVDVEDQGGTYQPPDDGERCTVWIQNLERGARVDIAG